MIQDQIEITQLILKWGCFRDQGLWQELLSTFHTEGTIEVSWYKGCFDGFVTASKEMAKNKNFSKHLIYPPALKINGDKATSETNVIIMARGKTGPLEVDITSYARFYDLVEKRDGIWRVLKRSTIYEKDRIDSVRPSFLFWIGSLMMNFKKYPAAYRYLAFGLEKQGYKIIPDIPIDGSSEANQIYEKGEKWLVSQYPKN